MATAEQYEDAETLADIVSDHLLAKRTTLVLGAGASSGFGLPGWDELLRRMYAAVGAAPVAEDLYRQAEHFNRTYCKNKQPLFMDHVHDALYATVAKSASHLVQNPLLAAVAALVMSSLRGNASEVITFNFDDMLETYLEYHGFVAEAIAEDRHWAPNADVAIYHPHGFLPYGARQRSSGITFDQRSYSKLNAEGLGLWRQRVLVTLRHRFPIFIGLSGRDGNLDAILLNAQESHASLSDVEPFWGLTFCSKSDADSPGFWQDRGVFAKRVDSYEDIPPILFSFCQAAAAKRRLRG